MANWNSSDCCNT